MTSRATRSSVSSCRPGTGLGFRLPWSIAKTNSSAVRIRSSSTVTVLTVTAIADGFVATLLPLLDRGVVTTVAHIRGGGELGEAWHDGGKMMTKRNTFTDFIDSTEGLLAQGYGKRGQVGIEGASAGGLLIGAVTNMRPDLFKVVLCVVPFVDVMNTMLDATLPLTVPEYEEWGNPNHKAAFDYMLSYSPYDNVTAKSYPAILVQTSFDDSQVMYWEPSKYVAKLRA